MARTVLLADDSVTAQNMGRRILMDAGYEVITVNNGSAALKKIHESQPDLIVLDVYMPGYGGLEVCQRLKESEETQRIPVLLSVGKMEPFKTDEAKRVRADGHIVKPFEASELLAALTRLEDRIVPPAEPARAKKKSGERKARFWHAGDDPVKAPEPWSDKIAYLAEVKERHVEAAVDPSEMPTIEMPAYSPATIAPPPNPVPMESAPQFAVVAESAPAPAQESTVQETRGTGSEPVKADVVEPPAAMPEPTVTPEPAAAEIVAAVPPEEPEASKSAIAVEPEKTAAETPKAPAESTTPSAPRWVAENVALSAEEASLALEQEMLEAQAAAATPAPESANGSAATSPAGGNFPVEPVQEKGATFAAAAAAASAVTPVQRSVSETDTELPGASEAAAAWQNWQQIRDSVMSPQNTSTILDSVAAAAHASASEPAQESNNTPTQGTADPGPGLEGAALASIVDSVLAELKPKLMEEISKKLKK